MRVLPCKYSLNYISKTTLLKCIAQLILLDEGKPFLSHKTPEAWGFPTWRSRVLYVPQRPRTSLFHLLSAQWHLLTWDSGDIRNTH